MYSFVEYLEWLVRLDDFDQLEIWLFHIGLCRVVDIKVCGFFRSIDETGLSRMQNIAIRMVYPQFFFIDAIQIQRLQQPYHLVNFLHQRTESQVPDVLGTRPPGKIF